jgi:polyisoprenoid-binding protein YceI
MSISANASGAEVMHAGHVRQFEGDPMTSASTALTLTGAYTLDPAHSRIGFVARHAMVTKVRGSFNEFQGRGYFDVDEPAKSYLEVTIKAASIDTRNADRDAHLRSNEFFDMDAHPEIRFVSTSVEPVAGDAYEVVGDLTIKGVTKAVAINFLYKGAVLDPFGNQRIGFEGAAVVNRKDWGVNWNTMLEAGGVLVGEKVALEFDVSAIRNP